MSVPTEVAFVGCGRMGSQIALRLHGAGHHVRCFDSSAEARERMAGLGMAAARSLAAVCEGASILFLCLPDDRAVEATICGAAGILAMEEVPSLIVDCTTSTPDCSVRMANMLADRGVGFVDAPVSGGVRGAQDGRLTTMVGGEESAIDILEPLLEAYSHVVHRSGGHGTGNLFKLVNNQLSALAIALTSEALSVGAALGVPPELVLDTINGSAAESRNSLTKFPEEVITKRFSFGFSLWLMVKDLSLAEGIIGDVPLLTLVRELYALALRSALEGADLTEYALFAGSWNSPMAVESNVDTQELDRRTAVCNALCAGVRLGFLVGMAEAQVEVEAAGADVRSALVAINSSSGMNAVTRDWDPGHPTSASAEVSMWTQFIGEYGRGIVAPGMRTAAALWGAGKH